jgi:hypothetical protein
VHGCVIPDKGVSRKVAAPGLVGMNNELLSQQVLTCGSSSGRLRHQQQMLQDSSSFD